MDTEERLAVFIDYENLALGARDHLGGMTFDFGPIADALAVRGRVVVRRAYADWSYFDEDRRRLTRHQVELIEMPQRMGASRKNAADIKMVVDAIEMAFEREYISTFVMCTGDSDFSPLVHKLRELNKRVIGVGVELSTSRLLPPACDEFLFYDRLEGVDVPDEPEVQAAAARRSRGGRGRRPARGEAASSAAPTTVTPAPTTSPTTAAPAPTREESAREAAAALVAGGATSSAAPAPADEPGTTAPAGAGGRRGRGTGKGAGRRGATAVADAATDATTTGDPGTTDGTAGPAEEEAPATVPAPPADEIAAEPRHDADVDADDAPAGEEVTMEVRVAQTLADLQASTSGAVTASVLKRTLVRKDPTFSEADYGFRTFGEFLRFLADRGFLELAPGPSTGDPEVSLPAQGDTAQAFALVREVVTEADGPVPLSGLKNRLRKRRPDFSEKALGFRGFLQFCRGAEEAGAVSLAWDDDADDYLVTPA